MKRRKEAKKEKKDNKEGFFYKTHKRVDYYSIDGRYAVGLAGIQRCDKFEICSGE